MDGEWVHIALTQLISLGGVVVLVGAVWLFGFRHGVRVDHAHDLIQFAEAYSGRHVTDCVFDERGRSALLQLADESVLVVRALGKKLAARVLTHRDVKSADMYRPRRYALGVRVRFRDAGFDDVVLETNLAEPPAWLDRLRRFAARKN